MNRIISYLIRRKLRKSLREISRVFTGRKFIILGLTFVEYSTFSDHTKRWKLATKDDLYKIENMNKPLF